MVDCVEEFSQPRCSIDPEWLMSVSGLWRPLCAEEKRRQSAEMVQMKVAHPNCVEVRPVESFLCHAMRGIRTYVEQKRAALRLQPEGSGSAASVGNRGARTEDNQLHLLRPK